MFVVPAAAAHCVRFVKPAALKIGGWRARALCLVRVRLELGRRQVERQHRGLALDILPSMDRKIERRDGAGGIFGGEAAHLRLGARAGQRGRELAKSWVVADEADAP